MYLLKRAIFSKSIMLNRVILRDQTVACPKDQVRNALSIRILRKHPNNAPHELVSQLLAERGT